MDLIDRLREIASRVPLHREHLESEEATKNALVLPFLHALGYNVFDPTEVLPEFRADVGIKKGEKVDYAIMRDAKPVILIECKPINRDLDKENPTQLYRYFSVTDARFSILTNGVHYQFYSDLEAPNKMDERPFFEFSILDLNDRVINEIKKFAKANFDLDNILSTASDLKYTKAIKRKLRDEWLNPSEEFVRLFAARVYTGKITQTVRDQFAEITKKAFHEFVAERINERLKSALENENLEIATQGGETASTTSDAVSPVDGSDIITSEEEIEGFHIVKSIVREVVNPTRIFIRDTKSYCGVLLDNNNRKPICRLHFNSSQKYLGLFDADKNETREPITSLDDIYGFADLLQKTALGYDQSPAVSPEEPGNGESKVPARSLQGDGGATETTL